MMKIRNAIILAAGRGSRMRQLTDNMPKCMMTINNKTLIQRTLEVLINNNINNIILITGYKSDVLLEYIRNTLNININAIYNDMWDKSNSIYSMYLAREYLDDAIVIDSDIYINNESCIQTSIEYSGYSAIKTTNTNEWQLITDENNFIKEVVIEGQYKEGLPIIDVSYWTKKDGIKIKTYLENNITDMTDSFWDEVPLIELIDELQLKRYDINENDAIEFDTPEELEKVRKIVCLKD